MATNMATITATPDMRKRNKQDVEKFHTERKYGNMSLILNGTDGGGNRYGYKYGYHYGYAGYAKEE